MSFFKYGDHAWTQYSIRGRIYVLSISSVAGIAAAVVVGNLRIGIEKKRIETGRLKVRDMNLRHQLARVEIARHENARNAIVWNTECCICLSIAEQAQLAKFSGPTAANRRQYRQRHAASGPTLGRLNY